MVQRQSGRFIEGSYPVDLTEKQALFLGRALLCYVALCALAPTVAAADSDLWVVAKMQSRGVDAVSVETFEALLAAELAQSAGVQARTSLSGPCEIPECVARLARREGAAFAITASLGRLGRTIVLRATAHDAEGRPLRTQRLSVDRVEDLEFAAKRLALALVRGGDAQADATLGTVTHKEVAPPLRRDFSHDLYLRVGAFVPFGEGYAAAPGPALALDVGYWGESEQLAIDLRLGVRFDVVRGDDAYGVVPLDIGVAWLPSLGAISPLLGAGIGPRLHWESRRRESVIGEVLPTRTLAVDDAVAFGLGGYLRAGVMLLRTYSTRLTLHVDYEAGYASLNGEAFQQGVTASVGVIF